MEKPDNSSKTKLAGGMFLCGIAGISVLFGFGGAVAMAKKRDPSYFYKGMLQSKEIPESGGQLAMRALGWGTLYAVSGFSAFCYVVWKLLGVNNLQEFRIKVGTLLPTIPRNESSEELKKVKTLRELLNYVIEEDKKSKKS